MLKLYKSYVFIDKDPVIDVVRTAMQDAKTTPTRVAADGGPTAGTISNWLHGKTRRPQFATVAATAGALGQPIRFGNRVVKGDSSRAAAAALKAQEDRARKRNGKKR